MSSSVGNEIIKDAPIKYDHFFIFINADIIKFQRNRLLSIRNSLRPYNTH